jgi:O-antigen/teichoic acid export membrane protein
MPLLARLNIENKDQWRKAGFIMNKILLAVVLPVSICLFVYAEQLISFIYGSKNYIDAVPILRIFALVLFVRFSMEAFALLLTTSYRQNIRLFTVIAATIINITLNIFMIPGYGAFGAAIVSLITNIFVGIVYYAVNVDLISSYFFNVRIALFLLLSLIISYLFWLIRDLTVFFGAPVLGLLFVLISYFLFFTSDEKKLILSEKFAIPFFKKSEER